MKSKTIFFLFLIVLLSTQLVSASHNDKPKKSECGLTNPFACLTDYVESLFNTSVKPLVSLIKNLFTEGASIGSFYEVWKIVMTISALISAIFLLISITKLILYSESVTERYNAKKTLQKFVLIIVLLPLTYYLYGLLLDVSTNMTDLFLNRVSTSFFEIKLRGVMSSIINLLVYLFYVIILILTIVLLMIRYLVLSVGVVFFPVGLLFSSFDYLKQYGSLILNFLFSNMFISVFCAIILQIFAKISNVYVFDDYEILLALAGFLIMDVLLVFTFVFSLLKSSFNVFSRWF